MNTSNNCDISQIGGNIHHTGFCDPIRADNNHHFMGHTVSFKKFTKSTVIFRPQITIYLISKWLQLLLVVTVAVVVQEDRCRA